MPKESRKDIAAQYAIAGVTGGVGRMVDKATSRGVSRIAERAAGAYKRRQRRKGAKIETTEPVKKLTGVGFWMMVTLAAMKDLLDILFTFTFFLTLLTIIFTIALSFIIFFYLFYNNVKFTSKALVRIIISFIIEMIPIVGALAPMSVISLFLIRSVENNRIFREFAEAKVEFLSKI
jgi:hypothetical protein